MTLGAWLASFVAKAKASGPKFDRVEDLRAVVVEKLRLANPTAESFELNVTDPARFSFVLNSQHNDADVTNLFGNINAYPEEDSAALIDRFVRMLSLESGLSSENLVTLIRTQEFVDLLRGSTSKVIYAPLVGDLVACGMFDMPDSVTTANMGQFPSKTAEQVLALGTKNMSKWLSKVTYDQSINPIVLCFIDGNPILTSGLLLLDDFWLEIRGRMSDDVFVAIPRRDQVFLLDGRRTDALPAMRKLIELTFQDNFSLLSPQLYRFKDGKLQTAE